MWVYVGDTHEPTSQNRTGWFTNQSFGEGMKSWDEISEAVNVTYEQTKQVDETAKIVGVSRWEVLEALGFSDAGHSCLMMNEVLVSVLHW